MKKLFVFIYLFLFFISGSQGYAQTARNSWSIGFGFSYPRFQSTDVRPQEENYGAYFFMQRYFSERVALRIKGSYLSMEGRIPGNMFFYTDGSVVPSMAEYMRTNMLSGNLDVLYNLSPCSPVSPYMGLGIGITSFEPDWAENIVNPEIDSYIAGQMNFIFGAEWSLGSDWELLTEISYHSLSGKLDGVNTINRDGVLGSYNDGYITANVGLQYYFNKGEASHYCDLFSGITVDIQERDYPTLDQIEDVIKRYSSEPAEIDYNRIEEIIKNNRSVPEQAKNWILYGVNFDLNKSTLTPESYPVLDHAASVLNDNPDLKVEIQGYTDNLGSEGYNQKLSESRAVTVKEYLVKKGVAEKRLTSIGMGKLNPVADNTTSEGRAKNRRVEFKVTK